MTTTTPPTLDTPGSRPAAAERPEPVVLCHAHYTLRGGEDESFEAEARLLESRGHAVTRFTFDNAAGADWPAWRQAAAGFWNQQAYRELLAVLRRTGARVVHCTNLFPFLSPSVYWAARRAGAAVVQACRNYRLRCLNSYLHRDGRVCESCLTQPLACSGIRHACYRDSRVASAAVALQFGAHRWLRTWRRRVDWFFTPSRFARSMLIRGGVPADRLSVKPNFLAPDPGPGRAPRAGALFVGRLSPEKGVSVLLDAWRRDASLPDLRVVGDGPLEPAVRRAAAADPRVRLLGVLPHDAAVRQMQASRCLIISSTWYETFGRTAMEALATGTPVVAGRLGAVQELVDHGRTGLLYAPGDAAGLAEAVRRIAALRPDEAEAMGAAARRKFLDNCTPDRNYQLLTAIYGRAREHAARRGGARQAA